MTSAWLEHSLNGLAPHVHAHVEPRVEPVAELMCKLIYYSCLSKSERSVQCSCVDYTNSRPVGSWRAAQRTCAGLCCSAS